MLTFVPLSEIKELEKLEGSQLNKAKEILAYEVTKIVHGEEEASKAQSAAKAIFESGQNTNDMPFTKILQSDFKSGAIDILDALLKSSLAASKGEARRLIDQGGISIIKDNETKKITSISDAIPQADFNEGFIIIKKGKKVYHKLILE